MSLLPPDKNWRKVALGKDERIWAFIILVMLIMMAVLTVGWVFMGKQNVPEEFERIEWSKFESKANSVMDSLPDVSAGGITYKDATTLTGEPVDIYLKASSGLISGSWSWGWNIKISKDVHYKLHISSFDVLHGFELIGVGKILAIQIVPGFDYTIDIIPTASGEYQVICNEFCGTGHHTMVAQILVE